MDTLQEGEVMQEITNEHYAVVKQTNTGMGTLVHGSSLVAVSIMFAAIGSAILGAGAKEEGGGGRRGGYSSKWIYKLDEGKSINWGVLIGIIVIGLALLGIAAYIVGVHP